MKSKQWILRAGIIIAGICSIGISYGYWTEHQSINGNATLKMQIDIEKEVIEEVPDNENKEKKETEDTKERQPVTINETNNVIDQITKSTDTVKPKDSELPEEDSVNSKAADPKMVVKPSGNVKETDIGQVKKAEDEAGLGNKDIEEDEVGLGNKDKEETEVGLGNKDKKETEAGLGNKDNTESEAGLENKDQSEEKPNQIPLDNIDNIQDDKDVDPSNYNNEADQNNIKSLGEVSN